MMPIFFHLESHLWIAYLFFFNGWMVGYLFANYSFVFRDMTKTFEAKVVSAFALSLSINTLVLLLFVWFGVIWAKATPVLLLLSALLIGASCLCWYQGRMNPFGEVSRARFVFYAFVFIILFYNGGLIEQISDAWWHMSLANKLGAASSFTLNYGHLDGVSHRYYPPLWHANLAMVKVLSGQSLVLIWNSFTAWGAVLKVMAFYLFSLSLTRDRTVSLFAIILFFLIPGMGISYMRVSSWPSHIAYVLMFTQFALFFFLTDRAIQGNFYRKKISFKNFIGCVVRERIVLLSLSLITTLVFFIHQLEVLWFFVGIFVYLFAESVSGSLKSHNFDRQRLSINDLVFRLGVLILFSLTCFLIYEKGVFIDGDIDRVLSYSLPIFVLCCVIFAHFFSNAYVRRTIVGFATILILISINYTHLASLLVPDLALPSGISRQAPLLAKGYFEGFLSVPGWHLQLRSALVYCGLFATLSSLFLVYQKPTRVSFFLSGNAIVALLFCVSPYLFQWLRDIMAYHSSWRIATLIFSPLIIAVISVTLYRAFFEDSEQNEG